MKQKIWLMMKHSEAERFKVAAEIPQGTFPENPVNKMQTVTNNLIPPTAIPPIIPPSNGVGEGFILAMPQVAEVNSKISANKGIMDDEFFHLTCHVDPNLKAKIEK